MSVCSNTRYDVAVNEGTPKLIDLPESVLLYILAYLKVDDLCQICQVNKKLLSLSEDNLLWQRKLHVDMSSWETISHSTFPRIYEGLQQPWSYKDIYLKCSPYVNCFMKEENASFHNLSNMLQSCLPKKTPKIAMLGPGLETSTRFITRKIMEDKTGYFNVTGMFPGQFEGLGSGFTILLQNTLPFSLVTLYSKTQRERENQGGENRFENNRLFIKQIDGNGDEQTVSYKIRPAVKDLCKTLDGFLFIVDVTVERKQVEESKHELHTLWNEECATPNVPLLVLACYPDEDSPRQRNVCEIVEDLELHRLSNPWLVQLCNVNTFKGMTEGLEWMLHIAQRR